MTFCFQRIGVPATEATEVRLQNLDALVVLLRKRGFHHADTMRLKRAIYGKRSVHAVLLDTLPIGYLEGFSS